MKLKAIKKIKQYKSFQDFTWQSFFNNEEFHDDVNILYGENGSGKTCICNILKNVLKGGGVINVEKNFGYKSFGKHKPKEVSLEFDCGECNFSYTNPIEQNFKAGESQIEREFADNFWDKKLNISDAILFFDREFVSKHVHLGHDRGTKKGQHEQESGDMIIQFDEKAINLRSEREETRSKKDKQGKIFQKFNDDNEKFLVFSLSDEEKKLYKEFKDKKTGEVKKIKSKLIKDKKTIEKALETDQSSQDKVNDIQNSIEEIENEKIDIFVSDYTDYQAIFNFDLKEQVKIEAEKILIEKLQLHKDFFETGFAIIKIHPKQCPFCQSKNEEENIAKIIKAYNEIFDDTYKEQSQQFINDKQELINELELIKQEINNFDSASIFLELKRLDENYKIKNIYSVNEERSYKKQPTKKINKLISKISKLKKPNKEDIKVLYEEVEKEFEAIEKYFADIFKFTEVKNTIIQKFKLDNTDEKLQKRILENTAKISEAEQKITFFNEKKIENQKKKVQKEKELGIVQRKFDTSKEKYSEVKTEYENYCSAEVFARPLKKIEEYFQNFNFNFKLKLKTEKTGNKTEFPFAFKVLDAKGSERDLKEGLSEGELQVLSLCFFFAFLDIQKDRKNKILIFDDPITSLDNSNLSYLVDLIAKEQKHFSQTFVFTHHRTFFKFLRKRFKTGKTDSLGNEYNIIRNKDKFGGSFICKSSARGFRRKLEKFETDVYDKAQDGIEINVELKIVEYGQYLRYEVEQFIKRDLLFWHADNNFSVAIKGIKENKVRMRDEDLDKISEIYSFCNWTTSHVDVGDDHGLQQLKDKITDFLETIKYNNNFRRPSFALPSVVIHVEKNRILLREICYP